MELEAAGGQSPGPCVVLTVSTMAFFSFGRTWWIRFLAILCVSNACLALSLHNIKQFGAHLDDSILTSHHSDISGGIGLPPGEQRVLDISTKEDVRYEQDEPSRLSLRSSAFAVMLDAIDVMQSHYFVIWQGTWPTAIDWTAAVMGTQVSATLSSISKSLYRARKESSRVGDDGKDHDGVDGNSKLAIWYENLVNQYFTQITSFYFGENAFSLRTQAYDDMLWVVLDWLESVKFIGLHSKLYHSFSSHLGKGLPSSAYTYPKRSKWYAEQFVPQFSHRARIFYDLASKGWNTSLCGGGMVWNPYLAPYKNAITNQLYIAASISMYLYFPGDENSSPFSSKLDQSNDDSDGSTSLPPAKAHDERYLTAAITAYDWLKESNMTNAQGLYVDGFHITGWRGGDNASHGTGNCDLRDEKVYTYNQGVIVSGLRGLFDATGDMQYLRDAHELIPNVINATGWNTRADPGKRQLWAGLGRGGVLEETCDRSGSCSQNGHTFKGIFFHHLSLFCKPLLTKRDVDRYDDDEVNNQDFYEKAGHQQQRLPKSASKEIASLHAESCKGYGAWVVWNARAAYQTRDSNGEYGTWWGWHQDDYDNVRNDGESQMTRETEGKGAGEGSEVAGTDYRNEGVPKDGIWRLEPLPPSDSPPSSTAPPPDPGRISQEGNPSSSSPRTPRKNNPSNDTTPQDLNDRGRGRTVETQSGGLAVIRALVDWRMWYG